jgi:lysylphosphatidylglycerol synthetase-like protein (DUF2156 family)
MSNFTARGFFLEGFMPMQMLVEMALITGLFGLLAHISKKRFRFSKFSQAIGLLAVAILYLKYRVSPPMPFSVLAMYTTIIAIGIFVWVSATEASWKEFYLPVIAVLEGNSHKARMVRGLALVILPILVGLLAFNTWKPEDIETPLQLRMYHPAPPSHITVHGKSLDLQLAENPFRIDENGNHLKPPQEWESGCANQFSSLREHGLCPDQRL